MGYIVDFITNEGADVTCSSREKPIPSVEDEVRFRFRTITVKGKLVFLAMNNSHELSLHPLNAF